MFKLQGRKSACTTCAGSSEILRWLTPFFGSKYGPQNGVQNWIAFSFLLLGLCLGPVLGSRFGPKSGVSHRRILLLPAEVLQADLRRTSMSVSVNTCFFSLSVPLCFLYSRGPFLAAMFLLVFWILFWEPWWSRFVGIRGAPHGRSYCGRNRLWGRQHVAGTGFAETIWEPRMWQGQVWEARPDGESTRGKAKFGKRRGSRKCEEENSATRRRHRGKGRKRQKTPSPPYNVPHTPLGIRRAGCFLLLCISQTPEMHPRPFFGGFWHPQWSFASVLPHPQGHPQASARALADMWIKMAGFPDLALRRCCLGW